LDGVILLNRGNAIRPALQTITHQLTFLLLIGRSEENYYHRFDN